MCNKRKAIRLFFVLIALQFTVVSFSFAQDELPQFKIEDQPNAPDYTNPNHWAALPFRNDVADAIPNSENWISDSLKEVDVFYIYPTLYLKGETWNADVNNKKLNNQIDKYPVKFHASVFNNVARVYAPRYRQAIIDSYDDTLGNGVKALDFAYEDIKKAFEYYLEHYNNGRPIIIASHSQGTTHSRRLLKDYFDSTDLRSKLVCAYTIEGDGQVLLLPRRDLFTRKLKLDHEQASHAVKLHTRAAGFDIDTLVARHYDQTLLGVGGTRSIGGAVWRLDVLHTDIPGRDGVWSLVTNLDYSWTLFGKNLYSFVEYFRNGFGVYAQAGYVGMDPQLAARVARGELYTLGRDNLVVGLQMEFGPLLNVFGTLLQNLNDGSRLAQLRGVYDWRQNLQVMAGVNLPAGERGSEYGGVAVAPGGPYLAVGSSVYARLAYYF